MNDMHHYYNQLTPKEKRNVDAAFTLIFGVMNKAGVPMAGDDRAERAVDALARAVIESRGEPSKAFAPKAVKAAAAKKVTVSRAAVAAALAPAQTHPDLDANGDVKPGSDLEVHLALKGSGLL